jgi:hypothetical protein
MHWAARAREAKWARVLAQFAWRNAGAPTMAGPVDVTLVIRRRRRMDPDNVLSSAKPILDGLFNDAITPDDSANWVRYVGVSQETGKEWIGAEEVVVRVTAREASQ